MILHGCGKNWSSANSDGNGSHAAFWNCSALALSGVPSTLCPLWGCAFEDLLTQELEPDGGNLVDDYLKRRGWNEKAPNKAYMRALRDTVMSLYEVSEVVPGQSMTLRDLLRDVAPVTVREHGATQTLVNWDKIAARIVDVNGRYGISGALLPFSAEGAACVRSPLLQPRRCAKQPPGSNPSRRKAGDHVKTSFFMLP